MRPALRLWPLQRTSVSVRAAKDSKSGITAGRCGRRRLLTWIVASGLLLPGGSGLAEDTDLFTISVAPNVLLLVDNSYSMKHIVWHPAFDPTETPSCSEWDNDDLDFYSSSQTETHCGNTRTIYPDPDVSGYTWFSGRYLNWLFSDAADPYVADLAALSNGTRSQCLIDEGLPATYSKYRRARVTAAQDVLREVICNVNASGDVRFGLARFYTAYLRSWSDPRGGYVSVPIEDYSPAQGALIDSFIDDLSGESWTPLSETLYNVYRYFQSRSNPIVGKNGTTEFPAYDIKTNGDTSTSQAPPSPLEFSCQRNFVILITDGEPTKDDFDYMDRDRFEDELIGDYNPDNTLPEAGDETPSSCSFCNETTFYLDDIAKWMHEKDFQPDFEGDQTIDVYTVGFTTADAANQLLAKTANVSNGLFFQSNNAEELSEAIISSVRDIIDKAQAFTSATVPASRTTDGNNFYSSYFLPKKDTGFWEGHLKNFDFSTSGEILLPDGRCATGLDITATPPCAGGVLRTFEDGFWDTAESVPAPANRNLYVEFGATPIFDLPTRLQIASGSESAWAANFGLVEGVDDLDDPYSGLSPNTAGDMAVALADVLSGCEFGSNPCVPRVNETGDKIYMGDTFHSNPVVVGSPNSPINEASYQLFAQAKRTRTRVIYAGANDGFLHGFNAGDWDSDLTPPRHDRGTGEELFGFMPRAVRDAVKDLPKQTSFPRTLETVDGSPSVADAWFYRDVSGSDLTTVNPLLDPGDSELARWRTVLVSGLRDGGQGIFALDVTEPTQAASDSATDYPRYLWGFPCDDCVNAENSGTAGEAAYMGFSWSEAVITRVRVAADGGSLGGYDRWVAIFGAGYHANGDPNGADYKLPSDVGYTPQGRAIYMVDITTGEVLARKFFDPNAAALASTTSPQEGIAEFHYAFASGPAVFDLNFDGYADVIYIGDLGGNVWKWVVNPVGDDPINNALGNNDPSQPNWPFRRFFRAGTNLEPVLPGEQSGGSWSSAVHYQSFFFPPTGALRQGKLMLAFGAGERANPQGDAAEYADGDITNNNHYYVLRDSGGLEQGSTVHPINDSLDESDLADFDDPVPLTCSEMQATAEGYYITSRDAEKFVTNSVIFLGTVFTGSFMPPDPASPDPCAASGDAYLYAFDLDCGVGLFATDPGGEADKRRKAIGSGIPTRPRVSVGDLTQGGGGVGGGLCANRVVMITSDGFISNDCPGTMPTSGVNVRSWRER